MRRMEHKRDSSLGGKETPPGSPPPPYASQIVDLDSMGHQHQRSNSQSISAAQPNIAQKPIISMEDDDESDSEQFIEENNVFKSLKSLTENENVAFLAVFLNFILSNSDPAPILFYLISDLYKDGNVKDMRKWAYEIHSTFLVPTAVSITLKYTCHSIMCTSITIGCCIWIHEYKTFALIRIHFIMQIQS